MAYEDRSYSGSAVETTLTANITSATTAIPIASTVGWPDGSGGPFHVAIAPAANPEAFSEVIRCSGRTGNTLNVQTTPVSGRGWDGTTPQSHITGAIVAHVMTATDLEEANQHIVNTGLDHHSQYLNIARHDLAARHGIANLPVGGTPSASVVGDTAYSGASGLLPRSDHRHAREGFGAAVAAGPTTSSGVATSLSRSDHVHAGGIPILAADPAAPIVGQTYINSVTRRLLSWNGLNWIRSVPLSQTGRTRLVAGRTTAFTIPDGGPSSHLVPWSAITQISDNFAPNPPNGTTSYTATIPDDVTAGLYAATFLVYWAALTSVRSYVELIWGDGVGGLYPYRVNSTGDDRAQVTAVIDMNVGNFLQVGAWQNSGAAIDISYYYFQMVRLQP